MIEKEIELFTLTLEREPMLQVVMAFAMAMSKFNADAGHDELAQKWGKAATFCVTKHPPKESARAIIKMLVALNRDEEEILDRMNFVNQYKG